MLVNESNAELYEGHQSLTLGLCLERPPTGDNSEQRLESFSDRDVYEWLSAKKHNSSKLCVPKSIKAVRTEATFSLQST